MSPLRARVEKGRLVLDEPTTPPRERLSTSSLTTKAMTLPTMSAAPCTKRYPHLGDLAEAGRLRLASAILDELRQRR